MPPAKRKSAFFSATQEAQKATKQENAEVPRDHENTSQVQSDTLLPSSSKTASLSNSKTVGQPRSDTASLSNSETAGQPKSDTASLSNGETVEQPKSDTASLQQSETVKQSSRTTTKKQEKISFYLTIEQAEKLDDLAYEHKKRTGKRINRNDIVRYLIDACSIGDLKDLK